jgi:hypothetical protein
MVRSPEVQDASVLPFGWDTQRQSPTWAVLPFSAVSRTECASEQVAGLAPPVAEEVTAWEAPPPKIGSHR